MSKITASMVKELRETTQAGMMDCKKALVETDGNLEQAITLLRKKSGAVAHKRAGRIAAEGIVCIVVSEDNKVGLMLELNCETDFVAKDASFTLFCTLMAERALAEKCQTVEEILNTIVEANHVLTFEQARQELVAKLGENIQLRRMTIIEAQGRVGAYVHGGRVGALVAINKDIPAIAKDLAMHIAASNPQSISAEDMDKHLIDQEREIYMSQAQASGKPDLIIAKMVEGRVSKFLQANCLVNQRFVKDTDQTIANLLANDEITVSTFIRYELGEGIEKKSIDFAQEVKDQLKDK